MANDDQKAMWNGPSGNAWTELQTIMDQMLKPFEDVLLEHLPAKGDVLDVGCGTGSTTIAFARRLGERGRVVGLDISAPMLALARKRAADEHPAPEFLEASAQDHAFDAGSFDAIVSRFGVMFFPDPVAAFTNLRRAARPGARLCFVAWRTANENPFMTTAERAVADLVQLPPSQPGAPGQFAFGERTRVEAILTGSGWSGVDLEPLDREMPMSKDGLEQYITRLGPIGRTLAETPEPKRSEIAAKARAAVQGYVKGDAARIPAACWLVTAKA